MEVRNVGLVFSRFAHLTTEAGTPGPDRQFMREFSTQTANTTWQNRSEMVCRSQTRRPASSPPGKELVRSPPPRSRCTTRADCRSRAFRPSTPISGPRRGGHYRLLASVHALHIGDRLPGCQAPCRRPPRPLTCHQHRSLRYSGALLRPGNVADAAETRCEGQSRHVERIRQKRLTWHRICVGYYPLRRTLVPTGPARTGGRPWLVAWWINLRRASRYRFARATGTLLTPNPTSFPSSYPQRFRPGDGSPPRSRSSLASLRSSSSSCSSGSSLPNRRRNPV